MKNTCMILLCFDLSSIVIFMMSQLNISQWTLNAEFVNITNLWCQLLDSWGILQYNYLQILGNDLIVRVWQFSD